MAVTLEEFKGDPDAYIENYHKNIDLDQISQKELYILKINPGFKIIKSYSKGDFFGDLDIRHLEDCNY